MTAAWIAVWATLGALVGSFANVVVYRWPRGESVVRPRSRCPSCSRTLAPIDLVPILSWLALRGRCRTCAARVSKRYPLVEAAMAVGFAAIAWAYPPETAGVTALPLTVLFAMLLMAALIDLDTYLLPDGLTLPAVAVAIAGSFLYAPGLGLPTPGEAAFGAAIGAGTLVLVNRLGSLVLRRFADTAERLHPISLDTVNVAAVAGVFGGLVPALVAGAAQVALSATLRRPVRLPEAPLYGVWLLGLVAAAAGALLPLGVGFVEALSGSAAAAGAYAVLGAIWWWVADWRNGTAEAAVAGSAPDEDDGEPVAMGFGDVKLAAALGAMLGWTAFLVGFGYAVALGAIVGVVQRASGGSRFVPFGPFLVAGAFLALASADAVLNWYMALLGL